MGSLLGQWARLGLTTAGCRADGKLGARIFKVAAKLTSKQPSFRCGAGCLEIERVAALQPNQARTRWHATSADTWRVRSRDFAPVFSTLERAKANALLHNLLFYISARTAKKTPQAQPTHAATNCSLLRLSFFVVLLATITLAYVIPVLRVHPRGEGSVVSRDALCAPAHQSQLSSRQGHTRACDLLVVRVSSAILPRRNSERPATYPIHVAAALQVFTSSFEESLASQSARAAPSWLNTYGWSLDVCIRYKGCTLWQAGRYHFLDPRSENDLRRKWYPVCAAPCGFGFGFGFVITMFDWESYFRVWNLRSPTAQPPQQHALSRREWTNVSDHARHALIWSWRCACQTRERILEAGCVVVVRSTSSSNAFVAWSNYLSFHDTRISGLSVVCKSSRENYTPCCRG